MKREENMDEERKEIKESTLASIDDLYGPCFDKLTGLIDYVLSNAADNVVHAAYQYADAAAISATVFSAGYTGLSYQQMLELRLYTNAFRVIFYGVTGFHWASFDFMDDHEVDELNSFMKDNFDENIVKVNGGETMSDKTKSTAELMRMRLRDAAQTSLIACVSSVDGDWMIINEAASTVAMKLVKKCMGLADCILLSISDNKLTKTWAAGMKLRPQAGDLFNHTSNLHCSNLCFYDAFCALALEQTNVNWSAVEYWLIQEIRNQADDKSEDIDYAFADFVNKHYDNEFAETAIG